MDKTKTKNIKRISTKLFYVVVGLSELGAIIMLGLVQGDLVGTVAKVIAVPLTMDFLIRVGKIVKPFFQELVI